MLQANLQSGAKAAGRPAVVKTTIWSFPIGNGPGNGRQFDNDDFSASQWNLRQITPNL